MHRETNPCYLLTTSGVKLTTDWKKFFDKLRKQKVNCVNTQKGLHMTVPLFLMIIFVILFVFLPTGLYLCGRVFIPVLAEKDTFFSSPKLGRIKARKRGGRIVSFFGNIVGKDRHVNQQTGRVEIGEFISRNFYWRRFGAYFIGLDDVYKYKIAVEAIEEITEGKDPEFRYIEKEASSIFVEGSYPLTAHFMTKDGVRLKIRLQLKLSTLDASKGLSLPISWTIPVFMAVLGASRDFFGTRSIRTLVSSNNDSSQVSAVQNGIRNSGYAEQILDLNVPRPGNISLGEVCGQHIDAVNLAEISFVDKETERAFASVFIAEQEAQAITLRGDAEAEVYAKKHGSIGKNSEATAKVITAEKQSVMGNLTTLVNGSGSLLAISADKKKGG